MQIVLLVVCGCLLLLMAALFTKIYLLKKAAKEVGEKSVAMIPVKEINGITGYIRGGCTAIGMKKQFVTRIDASAKELETMIVSGGRIGSQIELKPEDLCRAARAEFAEITQ